MREKITKFGVAGYVLFVCRVIVCSEELEHHYDYTLSNIDATFFAIIAYK